MISVFVVDDHKMVIEGLSALLTTEDIQVIGSASTAADCLKALKKDHPDVIFMDINLSEGNGMDLCKEVKILYPNIHVIGLSSFSQSSYVKNLIANGADGYILKNASQSELLKAITEVMKGEKFFSSGIIPPDEDDKVPSDSFFLTHREKEVVRLISQGMTNTEISGSLELSVNTIDTYRKNILQKLNVSNTAELVYIAYKFKLLD